MSGKELQRACHCLNISFTIVPDDVLSATELELARSLFPPENVPKLLVVGRVTSVSVKHQILSSCVDQQGWTVHVCDCCLMSVFVSDSANRAAVDGACKRESEFASIRASQNFSQTFGIAIPHKSTGAAAWHSIDDVSGCPQELLALATEQISNEKLAVDQRIKAYAYQQREQFEAYRQRTLVELEALSAAVVNAPDDKPSSASSSASSSAPFVRGSSPRTSPFHLTPPRASPTPPILSSAPRSSLMDRRPSINSSYPSRDSVSLDSPAGVDFNAGEITPGDDSIFEFEEDVGASSSTSGYYLSANTFVGWENEEDDDGEPRPSTEATRIPPLASRNEGFAIASSLPISIPQSFKFTPRGSTSTMGRGLSGVGEFKVGSARGLSTSAVNRQTTPTSRTLDDEDEGVVNMLLPPHTTAESSMRGGSTRKGSEKDAEEQFEHAVRFQSLSLKTRTYL